MAVDRAAYLKGVHERAGYKDRGEHVLQADQVSVTSEEVTTVKHGKRHEAERCPKQGNNESPNSQARFNGLGYDPRDTVRNKQGLHAVRGGG